jgi:ribosomal RNA-processing protein 9
VRKRARDASANAVNPEARRRVAGGSTKSTPTAYERKRAAMEADEVDSDIGSEEYERTEGTRAAVSTKTRTGDGYEEDGWDETRETERKIETVEEKRLRLARAYLSKVGLDPDIDQQDDDDGDEEDGDRNADAIARLQDQARKASGRLVSEVACSLRTCFKAEPLKTARSVCAHDIAATCVSLSTDGQRAASGGKDSRVISWDVETGRRVADMRPTTYEARWRKEPALAPGHVGHVLCVAVADGNGGNIFASGGADGLVRIWDARIGKQVEALRGHRGAVNALVFREASMQLFSASADRTVKIWDVNDMAYVETLFGHGAEVCAVDSFAKERAVSCGRDGTMRLYKILDGSQLVFRRALTTSLDAVAMVNEQRFISGGDDGAVCLWHVNKKRPVSIVEHAHGGGTGADVWVSAVAAGRNTDLAASGSGDGFVRLWQCADRPPSLSSVAAVSTGPGFVNGLSFGHQCRVLAAAIGQEPRLGRWERQKGVKSGVRFITLPEP